MRPSEDLHRRRRAADGEGRSLGISHLAASTLGGVEGGRAWLFRANRALGGVMPLSLLDTEIGERKVEEVLLQLTHGIYA